MYIRDVEIKDLPQIKEIICEAWDFGGWFETEGFADAAVSIYLNPILSHGSFGKVAILNDEVVGVIFGSVKGKLPKCRMLVEDSTDDIFTLMEGSSADRAGFCEFMRKLNQIYDDLIVDRLEDYNGTLDFFVVSEKARGQRIGKKLWNELLAYFEENQAKSIYVYTDSSCNFGFYDYNGFKRVATQDLIMNSEGNDECTEIYLYDYQL